MAISSKINVKSVRSSICKNFRKVYNYVRSNDRSLFRLVNRL